MGVAYAYLQNARRNAGILGEVPADEGTTNFHNVTADVMFKLAGFSLLSEFYYREGTRNPGTARDSSGQPIPLEPARDGMGFFAQVGYLLPRTALEVGARLLVLEAFVVERPLDGLHIRVGPTALLDDFTPASRDDGLHLVDEPSGILFRQAEADAFTQEVFAVGPTIAHGPHFHCQVALGAGLRHGREVVGGREAPLRARGNEGMVSWVVVDVRDERVEHHA